MTVYYLPFLHFSCFSAYLALGVYVWSRNRAAGNKAAALILALFAAWSLGAGFAHSPFCTAEGARVWYTVGSVGWIGFASAFAWFALVLTRQDRLVSRGAARALLVLLPLVFIYQQWHGNILGEYIRQPYGWSYVWSRSLWAYLFCAYYLGAMTVTALLFFAYSRRTGNPLEKAQMRILVVTILVAVPLGTLSNVIQQMAGIHALPPLADTVSGLIWSLGMVYAIVRYRLIAVSPESAVGNILALMKDIFILSDREGRILSVNRSACALLGYGERDLVGMPVGGVFGIPAGGDALAFLSREAASATREEDLVAGDGSRIPVLLTTSVVKDAAGAVTGFICIGKDIRELKQASDALILTLRRWQTTIDALKDSFMLVDTAGVVLQCNAATAAIFGRPVAEIFGRTFCEIVHGDGEPPEGCELARMRASGKAETVTMPVRDRWFEISANPVFDHAGRLTGAVHIVSDVTLRKRSEDEVLRLKKQLEFILGVTRTGIDMIDADMNMVYVDPVWAAAYGDYAGRKCYEYFMGRGSACPECGVRRALETKKPVVTEEVLDREGGRPVQVTTIPFQNEKGEWLVAEVNVDIAERKKADALLAASEARYRKFFEENTDAIFVTDPETKTIVDCNGKAEELTGYSRAELLSIPVRKLHPDDLVEETLRGIDEIARGGKKTIMGAVLTKDGRRVSVLVSAFSFELSGRKRVAGIFRDNTERERLDREIAKRLNELEKFSRFAIGRELKMMELKRRIRELEEKCGKDAS